MGTAAVARRASLALVCAGAIAGCFSDRGVAIEVDVGDTGATRVELYLGKTACDPRDNASSIGCTTIAPPPDGQVALEGSIWFRDAAAPYTAPVSGRTAAFQIRSDEAYTLPIVVAVGTAPGAPRPVAIAVLRDVEVPTDVARVITTSLVAAHPVELEPGDTSQLTDDRVLVWSKASPASSCLAVEHWDRGQLQRDFVVPGDDPDCDDVAAPECNPAAYHGDLTTGGGRLRPECFTAVGPAASICVLGALGCSDDVPGKTATCIPADREVCLPENLCGGGCAAYDAACLRMRSGEGDVTHIDCIVPTVMPPVLDLCPGSAQIARIVLDDQYAPSRCDRQPLISPLEPSGFDTHASFAGAEMVLGTPQAMCHFDLQWKAGSRSLTAGDTDYGVLQVGSSDEVLLIPIVFHFKVGACGTEPFRCMVVGPTTDSMWSCVK
jgi:hypothetical protein